MCWRRVENRRPDPKMKSSNAFQRRDRSRKWKSRKEFFVRNLETCTNFFRGKHWSRQIHHFEAAAITSTLARVSLFVFACGGMVSFRWFWVSIYVFAELQRYCKSLSGSGRMSMARISTCWMHSTKIPKGPSQMMCLFSQLTTSVSKWRFLCNRFWS